MSFILDALKKSETARQRQNGPALYEVKVAAPRSQLPHWAIGLIALLVINLAIVAWALLRRPSHPEAQAASTAATAPPMAGAATPAAYAPPANSTAPPPAGYPASPAGAPAPAAAAAQPPVTTPPLASPAADQSPRSAPAPANAAIAGRGTQDGTGETGTNPDDYTPAKEPARTPGFGLHVRRVTEDGVPLYSQVAGSGVPELRLDLWAYAPKSQDRFVLINMKRLREGDSLPEGVKVESITPDGVILSHKGSRFLLPRD